MRCWVGGEWGCGVIRGARLADREGSEVVPREGCCWGFYGVDE